MFCPDGVVDIPEACGAFNPGSNPGRDAFNTENWTRRQLWLVNSYRICLLVSRENIQRMLRRPKQINFG